MGRRVKRRKEKIANMHLKSKAITAAIILVCLIYVISCATVSKTKILGGVKVNGVKLSGCTQKEAAKKLNEQFTKEYGAAALTVKAIDQEIAVPMNTVLTFDAEKVAAEAFSYGHSNFILRGVQRLKARILGKKITVYPTVNDDALVQAVADSGIPNISTTVQSTYQLTDTELQVTIGQPGKSVDLDQLYKDIKKAVAANDYKTVIKASTIDGTLTSLNMDDVYNAIHTTKQEATLDPDNNYSLVESVVGIDFDKASAQKVVDAAQPGEVVHIEIVKDNPVITTADFKKHLFEKTIGKCTTDVEGKSARISNIKKAANAIDGKIIMPGEEFSFNNAVGKRTADNGYKEASVSYDGQSGSETGGGICQVASTLYKAVLLSNLEVTAHHTNTFKASYIDFGLDACIEWGEKDLAFKNNMAYPVKILADYDSDKGQLIVKVKGAKLDDYTVKVTSKVLSTENYSTEYQEDDSLYKGDYNLLQSGENGCTVQIYRKILDEKGKELSSEKLDKCKYSCKNEIIARGTKEVPTTETSAPTQETAPAAITPVPQQ